MRAALWPKPAANDRPRYHHTDAPAQRGRRPETGRDRPRNHDTDASAQRGRRPEAGRDRPRNHDTDAKLKPDLLFDNHVLLYRNNAFYIDTVYCCHSVIILEEEVSCQSQRIID